MWIKNRRSRPPTKSQAAAAASSRSAVTSASPDLANHHQRNTTPQPSFALNATQQREQAPHTQASSQHAAHRRHIEADWVSRIRRDFACSSPAHRGLAWACIGGVPVRALWCNSLRLWHIRATDCMAKRCFSACFACSPSSDSLPDAWFSLIVASVPPLEASQACFRLFSSCFAGVPQERNRIKRCENRGTPLNRAVSGTYSPKAARLADQLVPIGTKPRNTL